jgi:predicted transcriptional regulator
MINKKGYHKKKEKEKNRKRIENYFAKYPDRSQMECSKDLKLFYRTVLNHVKEMRDEGVI